MLPPSTSTVTFEICHPTLVGYLEHGWRIGSREVMRAWEVLLGALDAWGSKVGFVNRV